MSYGDTPFEDLIPPPDHIINTHKDDSIAAAVVFLGVLASIIVFARLGHRYASRNFGADDYAIVTAVLLYIGWTAMAAYMNFHSGIGKPIGEITYGEFVLFFKGIFVAAWMYPVMSAAIRVSVLFFYRRIFGKTRVYAIIIWVLIALQGAYVIAFEIIPGFSCHPISAAWDPLARYTQCSNLYIDETYALYSVSLAFDVMLLGLPIWPVWKLHLPLKRRIGIGTIFILGASATVVAAYKLGVFVYQSNNWEATDPNWYKYQASYYIPVQYNDYGKTFWIPTQLEPAVALIGTSLPAMLQVYSAVTLQFSRLRSRYYAGSRRTSSEKGPWSKQSEENLRFRKLQQQQQVGDSEVELRQVESLKSSKRSEETGV